MIKTWQRAFRYGVLVAVLTILAGCAGSRPGTEQPKYAAPANNPDVKIEHRKDTFTFDAKLTRVKIVNHYGDVRFRGSDQDEVGLNSIIQRIGTPVREPHFEIAKGADWLELRVRFADDAPDAIVDPRHGRVDMVVFVPSRISVDVETQSGLLQVGRFQGDVTARTTSGELIASTRGRMDLRTIDGDIIARQIDAGFTGASVVRSERGGIHLGIPTAGDFALDVEAGAGIGVTDAWKPGEIEPPSTDSRSFVHQRGAPNSRQINVRTGGKVTLAPVILLGPASRQ